MSALIRASRSRAPAPATPHKVLRQAEDTALASAERSRRAGLPSTPDMHHGAISTLAFLAARRTPQLPLARRLVLAQLPDPEVVAFLDSLALPSPHAAAPPLAVAPAFPPAAVPTQAVAPPSPPAA